MIDSVCAAGAFEGTGTNGKAPARAPLASWLVLDTRVFHLTRLTRKCKSFTLYITHALAVENHDALF